MLIGTVKVLVKHYLRNNKKSIMSTLSIKGHLIKKNELENIENKEGKKWTKQTFIIQTTAEYNNQICFQLFGEEKIKLLNNHKIGDHIEVFFNISSREYNNRYYHNIDAWKINHAHDLNSDENSSNNSDSETENLPF